MREGVATTVTFCLCFIIVIHGPCENCLDGVVALKHCCRRRSRRREEFNAAVPASLPSLCGVTQGTQT